jgi:hypothetical protein
VVKAGAEPWECGGSLAYSALAAHNRADKAEGSSMPLRPIRSFTRFLILTQPCSLTSSITVSTTPYSEYNRTGTHSC